MGYSYSLIAINSSKLEQVATLFASKPSITREAATGWYQAFGCTPDTGLLEEIDYLEHEDEYFNESIAHTLMYSLVTDAEWALGKSLHPNLLGYAFKHIPALRTIPFFCKVSSDVKLPKWPKAIEQGVYQAWSADAVAEWASPILKFNSLDAVRAYNPKPRLFGRYKKKYLDIAFKKWTEEHNWECWLEMLEAIHYCAANRTHLACVLIP